MIRTVVALTVSICVLVSVARAQLDPDRIPVESVMPGHPMGVPKTLLTQLQKDLGDGAFLPKTIDLLAKQLTSEKLSLLDARTVTPTRSIPNDAEFYWLWGPAGFCGSGGCSTQLYWVSPSSARAGRLFPASERENAVSFNKAAAVLTRSANGLFDLLLFEATDRRPVSPRQPQGRETTLTFDGQRYVLR